MAFAAAVAAYGQKLRGDTYLGKFTFADAQRPAGSPRDYWRQGFVKLVGLAASQQHAGSGPQIELAIGATINRMVALIDARSSSF